MIKDFAGSWGEKRYERKINLSLNFTPNGFELKWNEINDKLYIYTYINNKPILNTYDLGATEGDIGGKRWPGLREGFLQKKFQVIN